VDRAKPAAAYGTLIGLGPALGFLARELLAEIRRLLVKHGR
jgi:hypothetical protein